MTGLVRKATLFAVCGLLAANAAMASNPSAANSTVPGQVSMVGYSPNAPAPTAGIRPGTNIALYIDQVDAPVSVNVRDLNNLPMNNALVVVDFSACSGLQLCADQMQAGVTVICTGPGANTVRAYTDAAGNLSMSVGGHANNGAVLGVSGDTDPNNGLACAGCATITADGTDLSPGNPIEVSAYDQQSLGVGPSDLASFLGDQLGVASGGVTLRHPDRSDYNHSCQVGPADFSLMLQVQLGVLGGFLPRSSTNCGTDAVPNVDIPHCPAIP